MPRLTDFNYHLPTELIAQHPVSRRDDSRLLVLDRAIGARHHARFRDLPQWLAADDVLVVNDTRVFPARLTGRKDTGGKVELLLHHLPQPDGSGAAAATATHRGRLRVGERILFSDNLSAEVRSRHHSGVAQVYFTAVKGEVCQEVLALGEVPLPPYIQRPAEDKDRVDYQTVFAAQPGAVACPTAGLHFTDQVLQDLACQGVEVISITLHVGPGTFFPVRVEDYTAHKMLPEYFELGEDAASRLNAARAAGKALVSVGTTSVRVLEHCASPQGFTPQTGWCGLYIYPGYRFRAVDKLITNFHLPGSTLLLLVSAFAGREFILQAYEEAIRERYRFYSYGDCMLIL